MNWTQLEFAKSSVNTASLEYVLRTDWAQTVLVSLQPINTTYSRDDDARDQWTRRVTGSTSRTIRYDTRCYFHVRSKGDMNQLNLPHGTKNYGSGKQKN